MDKYRSVFESRISAGAMGKIPERYLHGPVTWKVMQRNAWKDIANWRRKRRNKKHRVATPCMDDHYCREEEIGSVGELSTVCSQFVLKNCMFGSVNKLARAIIEWTKARDKRLARLISYIHHTC